MNVHASLDVNQSAVAEFIEEMVATDGFDRAYLQELLGKAAYKQKIIDAISRPAEKTLTWKDYRKIFLTKSRIVKGRTFWADNEETLDAAEEEYGVPASIIVAVIGVETLYGKRMGNYRVLDALTTLAFYYPKRGAFFRSELKEFLLLAREEGQDSRTLLGSYAGAMGYGQFISSSFRRYAVDFDHDGVRDIWKNRADAIGSVANYLKLHGWERNRPVTVKAQVRGEKFAELMNKSLKPSMTRNELRASGIEAVADQLLHLDPDLKAAPIVLQGVLGKEYWLAFENFYVITRYNHSKLYAMAVFQLSQQIKSKRTAQL